MMTLTDNWLLAFTDAGKFESPATLDASMLQWMPARVPGTVAESLQQAAKWSLTQHNGIRSFNQDFDQCDWWYKTTFTATKDDQVKSLVFCGLASLSEIWLNGHKLLKTDNMFVTYQVDITNELLAENDLVICFRSLTEALKIKRPRPKWKTRLVEQQQLRWFRTSLLGRIPGWTPPVPAIGPWRDVYLLKQNEIDINQIRIKTELNGENGLVDFILPLSFSDTTNVSARLKVGKNFVDLKPEKNGQGSVLQGQLVIEQVEPWWPHTHGEAKLYDASLSVTSAAGETKFQLAPVGFKQIEIDRSENRFSVSVNGLEIFCRGACWTINDIVSLNGDVDKLEHTLTLMRDAGANMIRIGGTMIYEQDAFYQLCDRLGLLVWQDFMFANMDYPIDDADFHDSVKTEIEQTVNRICKHVSLAVYCGNSEVEQQVAMLGLDRSLWQGRLFTEVIPVLLEQHHNQIPYVMSSPTGGVLPFHVNTGLAHYYGVGAYLRPIAEVRRHDVRFTSECLGFANVPIASTRNEVLDGQTPVTHDPRWKARTPRDSGTGWDFEDVRDHYLQEVFAVDALALRKFEPEQYLRLSELVSGEIMSQVFAEWRGTHGSCRGGLVWFLKDFWPGAGWGIIDSHGLPKACYYYLKRAWQPVSLQLTNENINGVDVHLTNETTNALDGTLQVMLLNASGAIVADAQHSVTVDARDSARYSVDQILSSFYDVAYSYRFGPPKHTAVAVQFRANDNHESSLAVLFPQKIDTSDKIQAKITALACPLDENHYRLTIETDSFLNTVQLDTPGFIADNNYFHLLPGMKIEITLRRIDDAQTRLKAYLSALNLAEEIKIKTLTS